MKYTLFVFLSLFATSVLAKDFYKHLKLAKKGDASAQFFVASTYSSGDGFPENDKQAVYWYLKAAEQGHGMAQISLARIYASGDGVPRDDREAFYWYEKAARQGYGLGQVNIGIMYKNGQGIPKDNSKALIWLSISKAIGIKGASSHLEQVKSEMTQQQIDIAQSLAGKCFESDFKDC